MQSNSSVITVTGNLVSKNGVTLFMQDGSSMVLNQDQYETRAIMQAILPDLIKDSKAVIDLNKFTLKGKIEELAGGTAIGIGVDGALIIAGKDGEKVVTKDLDYLVEQAAFSGDAKGLKNFLASMEKIKRKHGVEELLSFMRVGKLPIADDGSIIAYKVLKVRDGKWFDPHTGKVQQKLGSLVYMPASKVDDNRRNECGVGLHVCSQSYIRDFYSYGNVLTLVKVKPADIISVPTSERSKMRACAYHVVALLPKNTYQTIQNDGDPLANKELAKIFGDVIVGNHPAILERVAVGVQGEYKSEAVKTKQTAPSSKKTARIGKAPSFQRGMSPKEVRSIVSGTVKASSINSTGDFDAALKLAKKLLSTVKGRTAFSLRSFCKEHSVSRTTLTKYLRDANLI